MNKLQYIFFPKRARGGGGQRPFRVTSRIIPFWGAGSVFVFENWYKLYYNAVKCYQIIITWPTALKSVNPIIKTWWTEMSEITNFDCVVSQSLFNLIPLFDLVEISWNWNRGLDSKLIGPNANLDIQGIVILHSQIFEVIIKMHQVWN